MGTPNWWRSLAYWMPRSRARRARPASPAAVSACHTRRRPRRRGRRRTSTARGEVDGRRGPAPSSATGVRSAVARSTSTSPSALRTASTASATAAQAIGPPSSSGRGWKTTSRSPGSPRTRAATSASTDRPRRQVGAGPLGDHGEVDDRRPAVGRAHGRHAQVAQRRPQLGVEAAVLGLHLSHPLGVRELGEQPVERLGQGLLLGRQGEVHDVVGSLAGRLPEEGEQGDRRHQADQRDEQAGAAVQVVGEVEGVVEAPAAGAGDGDEHGQDGEHEVVLPAVLEHVEGALVGPGGDEHDADEPGRGQRREQADGEADARRRSPSTPP